MVESGLTLRPRDQLLRFRPDVLLTATYELTYTMAAGLGRDFDPEQFLSTMAAAAGASIGVAHAVALAQIQAQACDLPLIGCRST